MPEPGAGATQPQAPGGKVTTGGERRPQASAPDDSEWSWTTWWYFNRWTFLPSRNAHLRRQFDDERPVTGPRAKGFAGWDARRDHVARTQAIRTLERMLTAKVEPADDDLKAAAALGVARLSNSAVAVQSVMRVAEDPRMSTYARGTAAFAAGLFRRTDPARRMSGARLDRLRERLLRLSRDVESPRDVRCLAVLALGMLADQPTGNGFGPGVLVTRALWKDLLGEERDTELTVARLTALGRQPSTGVPEAIRKDLRRVVFARRFAGRPWNACERSHAFSALAQQGGPTFSHVLARALSDRSVPVDVRRAAFLAVASHAEAAPPSERATLMAAWDRGRRQARDPLTKGLAAIALGRLLAADFRAGRGPVIRSSSLSDRLLREARVAPAATRGFAVLGLALAARAVDPEEPLHADFRRAAERVLHGGLRSRTSDARVRGAYAVAAGLAGMADALPELAAIVADRNADLELRGFAAVATGQIGRRHDDVLVALRRALSDHRSGPLRRDAALALVLLNGDAEAALLRAEMDGGRKRRDQVLGQVALALGQMGDLEAIPLLAELAVDESARHGARGAAAVALGLICDPEETPSLERLWRDANYPARTEALHDALDFL